MAVELHTLMLVLIVYALQAVKINQVSADEACLLRYDTNDTSIQLDLSDLNQTYFRGEPGIPGKRGPAGPPGPIGGSENDTTLRIRYDDKIAALEARLNALSDASWFLATNGLRYKVITVKKNFQDAKAHCQAVGGHLSTVGMRQSLTRFELKQQLVGPAGVSVWIGLADNGSQWEWLDGVASSSGNTDWDTPGNEPNNSGGNEKCAHMRSSTGRDWRLNDQQCKVELSFLCERAI